MKDIGSIFPVFDETDHNTVVTGGIIERFLKRRDEIRYYSLCREAIYDIAAMQSSNRRVLLPAYTCQTVIDPFEQLGYEVSFYNIEKNLRIDIESFIEAIKRIKPSLLLVHPYYGMELNDDELDALLLAKTKDIIIILDTTQCLFTKSNYECVDYYVGSIRKWLGIPDGGYVSCDKSKAPIQIDNGEFDEFVKLQLESMVLRGQYFLRGNEGRKQKSRELQNKAVECANKPIKPHQISNYSLQIIYNTDYKSLIERRIDNFNYLHDHLSDCTDQYYKVIDKKNIVSAPLYFPIYCNNRQIKQKQLAKEHIYAPVLWPVEDRRVLQLVSSRWIYESILAIPCDQRYDLNDMKKIVDVLDSEVKI